MNMWEEALHHERVLREAVSAVDAARAAGDATAETAAVAAMHAAEHARNQFIEKWRRKGNEFHGRSFGDFWSGGDR